MTFRITAHITIFEDHYTKGQGELVRESNTSRTIHADNALDALKEFYKTELYRTFNDETITIDRTDIFDGWMVDRWFEDASESELELFKTDQVILYCQYVRIEVYEMKLVEIRF